MGEVACFFQPPISVKKKKKTCDFLYPGACTLWYTFPPQLGRSCVNIIFTFWEPYANHTKVASSKILACVNSRFSSLLAKERGQNGCFRRLLKSISSARQNWAINRAQKPYPCTLHIPRPVAEKMECSSISPPRPPGLTTSLWHTTFSLMLSFRLVKIS